MLCYLKSMEAFKEKFNKVEQNQRSVYKTNKQQVCIRLGKH